MLRSKNRTSTPSRRQRMLSSQCSAPGSFILRPGCQTPSRLTGSECRSMPSHRYPSSRWFSQKSSGSCAASSSPLLAASAMILAPNETLCRDPDRTSQHGGSSSPAEVWRSSLQSSQSSPNWLAIVKRSFSSAGLSDEAAEMAARSQRQSTRHFYNSRLWHFAAWCSEQHLDPTVAPLASIADMFMHLFKSGL